jgi:outer membrane protein OmpA-like peptidoglycan-associated protein
MLRAWSLALPCAVVSSLLLSAGSATAQEKGFALNRFEPSERGSSWFVLESLDFRGRARPAFGVVGDYQHQPLAIYEGNGDVRAAVVDHVLTAHVGASVVLGERLRLAASLPFVLYQTGDAGNIGPQAFAAPANEQAVGDLRLGADLRLFGNYKSPITMALGAQLWAPTGDPASYTGDGRVRVAPRVLAAGAVGPFVYAGKVGVMIRDPEAGTFAGSPVGHELIYAASAGLRVLDERLTVGPELFGSTVLTDDTFKTRTTPFELLFGGHYAFQGGFRAGAGVGPGLTRGYGTPAVRALLSLEWSPDIVEEKPAPPPPPPPPPDRDGDGIIDAEDACPDIAGQRTQDSRTNGCADKDGDGILDPLDACVDVPGVPSEDPKQNGCPELDTDKDGILDKEDACPKEPGIKTSDPKTNGCPDPDRDKDGVLNDVDACPDEPGKPDPDPKKNGCPKAFVAQGQIKILDQVKFKTNSAEILPGKDSEEVLQAVLKVMKEHPEIKQVRVEGHTDDRGAAALNRTLSQNRAASVVKWLTKNGIEKERLTSAGFGPDKPIDSNKTEEGRRNNRRVEFHIAEGPQQK